MKIDRLLAAGVFLGLGVLAGTQAMAQAQAGAGSPVNGSINFSGSVLPACLFTGDAVQIDVGQLNDAVGRLNSDKVDNQTVTLHAWCNGGGSTMSVQATALSLTPKLTTLPDGFVQAVDFTATATANGHTATGSSKVGAPSVDAEVGIFSGNVPVVLTGSSATGILVAGPYLGAVTVTFTPG